MDDPLVDADGFPRSDIDVYQVRHARSNIRSKGNDLTSLVGKIEMGLHSLHAQARETTEGMVANRGQDLPTSPFARVLVVLEGCPPTPPVPLQRDWWCWRAARQIRLASSR